MALFSETLSPGHKATIGLGLMGLGVVAMAWSGMLVYWAYESTTWPTAEGHMILATVKEEHSSKNSRTTYMPMVKYAYRTGERRYESDRLMFCEWATSSKKDAQATIERYPVLSSVTVRYHPEHPEIAVLEPGATARSWIWPTIAATAFVFGAAMLMHAHREAQGHRRPEYLYEAERDAQRISAEPAETFSAE